jgi:2,5-furandicarboxylate decarboxylase 1
MLSPGLWLLDICPSVGSDIPPISSSKLGLDCTIPLVGGFEHASFDASSACDLGPPPTDVIPMDVKALTKAMETFIQDAPRSWKEILQRFHGQPYQVIYQAFSNLRPKLGRAGDSPWFSYTFSDHDFTFENKNTTS